MAVGLLVVVFWWLLPGDGGFGTLGLAPLMWWMLALAPLAVAEARFLARTTAVAVGLVSTALVASVVLGQFRSGFVDPLAGYALMVEVGLAAHRLVRRRWGRPALVGLLSVSMVTAWVLGAAVWFGSIGEPRWLVLSWHNQSAAVMAAGAAWFAALAWRSPGIARIGSVVGSGACLAAVYLTGSRGGLIVVGAGLALVAGLRVRDRWKVLVSLVGVAVAVSLALGVTFFRGDSPLEQREGTAEVNAVARFAHWEAAVGMFADDPITGLGVGSYAPAAPGFNRADMHLTSSAHNEFLELAAEGGVLVAIPVLLLVTGGAVGALRLARRSVSDPLQLGAAGLVLVLGAHALIDFDWLYPVLAGYFAAGLGMLARQEEPRPWAPHLPVALVLVAAVSGIFLTRHPSVLFEDGVPWIPAPAVDRALASTDPDEAVAILEQARAWNPGDNTIVALIPTFEAIAGRRDPAALVDLLELPRTRFATYDLVAKELGRAGHLSAAIDVTEEALAAIPDYVRWGSSGPARSLWETRLTLAYLDGGCTAYVAAVDRLEGDPSFELYGLAIDRSVGLAAECLSP